MLYNGIELPDINDVWTDKAMYPYAFIRKDQAGTYRIYACTDPLVYSSGKVSASVKLTYCSWYCGSNDVTWTAATNEGTSSPSSYFTDEWNTYVVWANHDIIDTSSNTIYLTSSDPVTIAPVDAYYISIFLLGQHLRHSLMGNLATTREMKWVDAENEKLTFAKIEQQQLTWSELIVRDWPDK